MTLPEECSMKFQSIALIIHHTFKNFKTIKSPTICITVSIIRGKIALFKLFKV